MNNYFLKPIFLCFIVCVTYNHVFANVPEDTITKKALLASAKKSDHSSTYVIKVANVVLPDIFMGNEAQFIDYVEKFSSDRKDYLLRTYKRSKKYFPKAVTILKRHQVPAEFAALLALESGFNGNAVSSAGAVGYWQIMDEVAKEYGLKIPQKDALSSKVLAKKTLQKTKVKLPVDDRKNFVKSTYAAARYLKDRVRNLNGDWLLIAASYNCGVGNVWNAMQRCGTRNPNFWDIKNYLPAETRAYVMNFITLNVIFKNYENFSRNQLCFRDIIANKPQLTTEQD